MRARTSGRQLARTVDRSLPPALRRAGRDLVRRARRPGWRHRAITVVLAVTDDDEPYVEEALDSLGGQRHPWFTVLAVPFGTSDRAMRRVRRRARSDTRIVPVRSSAGTRGAAYDRGAQRARTPYLTFMDAADVLPPRALEQLVDTLSMTGSDFVVGQLEQAPQVVRNVASVPPAHREDHLATTVEQFPPAVTDTYEQNRLYRCDFWRSAGLRFTAGPQPSSSPAVDAYFAARAFDLVQAVTYVRMNRSPGSPFGQAHNSFEEFDTWLASQDAMMARLAEVGAEAADWMRDSWLSASLEIVAHTFLKDVERATDEQWASLRDHVARGVAEMSDEAWRRMAAEARVRVALLLAGLRDELTDFVAERRYQFGNRRTEVRDGTVYADLPFFGDARVGLPDEMFEMSESETPLKVVLRTVRWDGPETLELGLVAYIDFLDLDTAPDVRVDLVDATTQERHPLEAQQFVDPTFAHRAAHRYQNFDRGGVRLRLDAAWLRELAEKAPDGQGEWTLEFTLSHRGVTRRGTVTSREERTAAETLRTPATAPRGGVALVADDLVGLRIRAGLPQPVSITGATVAGRKISVELEAEAPVAELVASRRAGATVASPVARRGSTYHGVLELPPQEPGATWRVQARTADGRLVDVDFPAHTADRWIGVGNELVLARTGSGGTDVVEARAVVGLDRCELGSGAITVRGRWLGEPEPGARLSLAGRRATTAADVPAASTFEVTLPTRWDPWALRETGIPWDDYTLSLAVGTSAGRLLTSDAYDDRLLEFQVNHEYRMRPSPGPGIELYPALADDERGPFHQERMKIECQQTNRPVDAQAVYLQAYGGLSATDSQLAIHQELRRCHPELTLYWGVVDGSSWVPEGGEPVLINSREWYQILGTAGHLVTNIDLPRWFRPRPGQRVLQTFHGYPSKSMGIRMWTAKNFTPRRIESELARTSGTWDMILTPSPEMDRYYREEYRYDGPIHSHGYPRDDVLVSADADRIRVETRARLGIRPGQTAVLYAPTWRDDMASNWRRAALVTHLDLSAATSALGEGFVFLLRGHRFHSKASGRGGGADRCVDVTDYPEVNDLILAADAAVLDYSSLRFDFSLTGRPMIFLVPDLAEYTGGVRGFLYPFTESAPGPLLDTTDEVVAALRDLDGVQQRYADQYAAFHARFNRYMDGTSTRRVVEAFFDGTGR